LILDKVELFVNRGFSEVKGVFEIIVGIYSMIVFFNMGFLAAGIEFLEMR
jgi:hypothetical protein